MVAHDPLHRSGRAELPHPAPTLGENVQALIGIRVADVGARKPELEVAPVAPPGQAAATDLLQVQMGNAGNSRLMRALARLMRRARIPLGARYFDAVT